MLARHGCRSRRTARSTARPCPPPTSPGSRQRQRPFVAPRTADRGDARRDLGRGPGRAPGQHRRQLLRARRRLHPHHPGHRALPAGRVALHPARPREAAVHRRSSPRSSRSAAPPTPAEPERSPGRRPGAHPDPELVLRAALRRTRTTGTRRFSSRCPRGRRRRRPRSRPSTTSWPTTTRFACAWLEDRPSGRWPTIRRAAAPSIARVDLTQVAPAGSGDGHRDRRRRRPSRSSTSSAGRCSRPSISTAATAPGRLLLAVHHLAVDGVSWRDPDRGPRGRLPRAPGRRSAVSCLRRRRPSSAGRRRSRTTRLDRTEPGLPGALAGDRRRGRRPCRRTARRHGENTEALGADRRRCPSDREETQALLQQVPAAYRHPDQRRPPHRPRAGAARLDRTRGPPDRHRRARTRGMDRAPRRVANRRLVHDASIPVALDLEGVRDEGSCPEARQGGAARAAGPGPELRRSPLRVHRSGRARDSSPTQPSAELLFNYLGQFDQVVAGSELFRFADEPTGPWHGPTNERTHRLEVVALVRDGRFEARWIYGAERDRPEVVERLAEDFIGALRRVIEHCTRARSLRLHPVRLPPGPARSGRPRPARRPASGPRGRLSPLADAALVPFDGGGKRPSSGSSNGSSASGAAGRRGASRSLGGDRRRATRCCARPSSPTRSARAAPGRRAAGRAALGRGGLERPGRGRRTRTGCRRSSLRSRARLRRGVAPLNRVTLDPPVRGRAPARLEHPPPLRRRLVLAARSSATSARPTQRVSRDRRLSSPSACQYGAYIGWLRRGRARFPRISGRSASRASRRRRRCPSRADAGRAGCRGRHPRDVHCGWTPRRLPPSRALPGPIA